MQWHIPYEEWPTADKVSEVIEEKKALIKKRKLAKYEKYEKEMADVDVTDLFGPRLKKAKLENINYLEKID